MSCRLALVDLIAHSQLRVVSAALHEWHLCAAPPYLTRQYKRVKLTDRDTDLITESLDDRFGEENPCAAAPLNCCCLVDSEASAALHCCFRVGIEIFDHGRSINFVLPFFWVALIANLACMISCLLY